MRPPPDTENSNTTRCAPQPLTKIQQQLVTDNIGLAVRVLQTLNLPNIGESSDARGEAMLALTLAARSYDAGKGIKFSTHAWNRVRWHMLDWIERQTAGRRPYTVDLAGDGDTDPEQEAISAEFGQQVASILSEEAPDVQSVAVLTVNGLSNTEMAAATGRSKSWIERRRAKATSIMRVATIICRKDRG